MHEKGKLIEKSGRKATDLRRKQRWLSYHGCYVTSLFRIGEAVFLFYLSPGIITKVKGDERMKKIKLNQMMMGLAFFAMACPIIIIGS